MKIFLDRSVCNCWESACESDFADKFLGKEVLHSACTVFIEDEEHKDEIIFFIKDRDGTEKEFVVNDENLNEAIDSWFAAYEEQQTKIPEN